MYGLLKNGELKLYNKIPNVYKLIDGRTVTNYNLLPEDELKLEGWMNVIEHKPNFDLETQQLEISTKEIVNGEIVVTYVAVDKSILEYEETV